MSLKILLVEDQPIIALSMISLLENAGYEAERLAAGEELIKKLKDRETDLIIMDIRLNGGMDGIATAREVRKFNNVPIIFMSGSLLSYLSEIDQINNSFKISKPVDFKELRDLISEVTGVKK